MAAGSLGRKKKIRRQFLRRTVNERKLFQRLLQSMGIISRGEAEPARVTKAATLEDLLNRKLALWQKMRGWLHRNLWRSIKTALYYWPRRKWFQLWHGFDYRDTWDLRWAASKWLYPRLNHLRENAMSYPGGDMSYAEWIRAIGKMAESFRIIAEEDDGWTLNDEKKKEVEEGLDLFRKWFFHLWD